MSRIETDLHLWDHDHPYYCSESNYFSNDTHRHDDTWAVFMESEGTMDPDLNLVFRWDWLRYDADGWSDPEDRKGPIVKQTLWLFIMGQRKGLFRVVSVNVTEADEPSVREWLTERARTIEALWQPFLSRGH